jgi:hypothetical protein
VFYGSGLLQSRWLCESLGLNPAAPPEYGAGAAEKRDFGAGSQTPFCQATL